MIVAAFRMTLQPVFVAGAVLWIGGAEKSQNELARGCERSTDLSIFGGSLAEVVRP
jgi:hypothetical protein